MRLAFAVALVFFFVLPLPAQEVTGSDAVTAQYRDPETIQRITLRLAGHARESWDSVLSGGNPPLTWGTVASFSLLLHECYDTQLTEAEAELLAKALVEAYVVAHADGKKALVQYWNDLLSTANKSEAGRRNARAQMDTFLRAAVSAKVGWAIVVREALDRRNKVQVRATTARPQWANVAGFDDTMSTADLDASLEMLYFMWVAAGRDPELVTLEGVATVRALFQQNFRSFPADFQFALTNAQKIYAGLRVLWYTGNAQQRANLAASFQQQLNALGLTDPNAAQSAGTSGGMSGDAHSAFAADMVVGLAGSSYKSAW
jgi:hypothetical protein